MGDTLFHLRQQFPKRFFDVTNRKDLLMYKQFITTYSWGNTGCPFELEWPWLNIPDMIAHKIAAGAVENL